MHQFSNSAPPKHQGYDWRSVGKNDRLLLYRQSGGVASSAMFRHWVHVLRRNMRVSISNTYKYVSVPRAQ